MASRRFTAARSVAAALALALVASGCSSGDSGGGGRDRAATLLSSCPDLALIACNDQVVEEDVPITGTGMTLHYRSDRVPGRKVAPRWDAAAAVGFAGWTLSEHHVYDPKSHTFFGGDGTTRSVPAVPGEDDELLVASVDGREVYAFSSKGRHLRTVDGTTGALLHRFEYDDKGRLVAVNGCHDERTTITRTPAGLPFEIVAPTGHGTRLYTDSNDYLASIIDPAGGVRSASYGRGGLLSSLADPGGRTDHFEFDDDGRLTKETDAAGVVTTVTRTTAHDAVTVAEARGGRSPVRWTYEPRGAGGRRHTLDVPGRGRTVESISADGTRSLHEPDGTTIEARLAPDPRWAMQAPVLTSLAVTTPSGHEVRAAETRTTNETHTTIGNVETTRTWDPATQTFTTTDARGNLATAKVDACGNPTAITEPGRAPIAVAYDERGRPTEVAEGAHRERVSSVRYLDTTGEVEVTDPAGQAWRFASDPLGHIAAVVRPDGRRTTIERNPSDDPIAVSIDGEQVRTLGWSPIGRLRTAGPTAAGLDLDTMSFDELGRPARLTRPGGGTVDYRWTDDGRPTAIGPVKLAYDEDTGVLTSASTGDSALRRTYDGSVPVGQKTSGAVKGSIGWERDDAGRLTSIDVDGTPEKFAYDDNGDLVGANGLAITREPSTGRVTSTDAGVVHTDTRYDDFGDVVGQTARSGSDVLFDASYTRDALGRVTSSSETIQGETHAMSYAYDKSGRLTQSTKDGVATDYTYDDHDNRTSAGGVPATFDATDQPITRGDVGYVWNPDHTLHSTTTPAGKTTFDRDALGEKTGATLPDGREVTYVSDPLGRRTATLVDDVMTSGFLYGDDARPLAATGADGAIDQRFVYTGPGAPSLIEGPDGTSRVVADLTGSPRLVVDSVTGKVQQRLDFDPFGQTTVDTNPGFQPMAFGGGTADPLQSTVNIDGNEYDPGSGEWWSPAAPLGGSPSVTDPVNSGEVTADGPMSQDNYVGSPDPSTTGLSGGAGNGPGAGAGGNGFQDATASDLGGAAGADAGAGLVEGGGEEQDHEGAEHGGGLGQAAAGSLLTSLGAGAGIGGFHHLGGALSGLGAVFGLYEAHHIAEEIQNGHDNPYNQARYGAAIFGALAELAVFAGLALAPIAAVLVAVALAFALVALVAAITGGSSSGDPHLTTHDGRNFELQAVGELVLARTDDGSFEAQVRQQPAGTSGSVSINTAVAVGVDGDRVAVYADSSPPLRINGVPVDLPAGSITLPHGGTVVRLPTGAIQITGAKGDAVLVRIVHRRQLAITVGVSDAHRGHVVGLYGNANDDPDDDLASSDGTVVDAKPSDFRGPLYAVFAKSWRVTQAASLFDYAPGTDTSTFTDIAFPKSVATVDTLDPARRESARAACQAGGVVEQPFLDNCTLDVALLDDTTMIATAVDAQRSSAGAETGSVTTAAVGIGETVSGRIREPLGEAHYSFNAKTGDVVYVSAGDDCDSDNGLLWVVVGPTGSAVAHSATLCSDLGVVEADRDGTYTVRVVSRGDATGRFSFTVRSAEAATTDRIAEGDHVAGRIAAVGQRHVYTFSANAGDVVYLRAGVPCATDGLTWMLTGPDGSAINASNDLCVDLRRQELDRDGTYTIAVSGRGRTTGAFAFDLLAGDRTETSKVSVGDHVTGTIGRPGSRHRYELDGRAGDVISLHAAADCTRGKQQWDVLGPAGSRINVVNDVCSDIGRLELDLDGTYVISVTGYEDEIGDYAFDLGSS